MLKCIFGEKLMGPALYIAKRKAWICATHDIIYRHDVKGEDLMKLVKEWSR